MRPFLLSVALVARASQAHGQGFIASVDDLTMLSRRPAIVLLATGDSLIGRFEGAGLTDGYMGTVVFRTDSGKVLRIKPEEIARLSIRPSTLARLEMTANSANSIREIAGADFEEIAKREFIIFEPARRTNRAGTIRLMQLLNPGFDGRIKVFADPNARKTLGLSLGGVRLAGGEDKSFLFVLPDDRTVLVKKSSYADNFTELYGSCSTMVEGFSGARMRWDDVAAHVFVFDRRCGTP